MVVKLLIKTLALLLFFSCSKEESQAIEVDNLQASDHSVVFEDIDGEACCVIGADNVTPATQEIYEYTTNINSADITWQVISGSMELVGNENSSTVTIAFADDFTEGVLEGMGSNNLVGCAQQITISKK